MTEPDNFADIEPEILETYVRNQLEIKRLTEANEKIKAYYKQESEVGEELQEYQYETRTVGKFYVQTSPNTRFDEAQFKAAYPEADWAQYYKSVPDTARIKKAFTPESYASFQKVFAPKVSIDLI